MSNTYLCYFSPCYICYILASLPYTFSKVWMKLAYYQVYKNVPEIAYVMTTNVCKSYKAWLNGGNYFYSERQRGPRGPWVKKAKRLVFILEICHGNDLFHGSRHYYCFFVGILHGAFGYVMGAIYFMASIHLEL